jgi:hypothetical protein
VFVHARAIHDSALALIAAGVNDCEIARRLGVPRTTVRDWRAPRYAPRKPFETCWRCWRGTRKVAFTAATYAELLGLYLGDGHITRLARTERLRIFLDSRHGSIVGETDALMRRCFPANQVGYVHPTGKRMVVLWLYHGHLSCLFPQHGPGKKHERPIVLEPWQRDLVDAAPWALLRGLIHSDGCVFVNRTGKYEYLSYEFKNKSADIRELFLATCDRVGVACSVSGVRIAIYRRPSVALMWEHVGGKS